jgi:hypothetical protein
VTAERSGLLTSGRIAAIALAVAAIALTAVLVTVFGHSWWRGTGGSYAPGRPIAALSITPESSLFGDVLTATARVIVDPRQVDPKTVALATDFRPYHVLSESERRLGGPGRATSFLYTYSLVCITSNCLKTLSKNAGQSSFTEATRVRNALLTAKTPDGNPVSKQFAWPLFVVHSRLSADEIGLATPELDPTAAPPPVSWRLSPDLVGALALSLSVVLALIAAALVILPLTKDARRLRAARIPKNLSPVERALRLAEHAARTGEFAEERKALQRLAVELERRGSPELAARAVELAWSEDQPGTDAVDSLATSVRSNGAH